VDNWLDVEVERVVQLCSGHPTTSPQGRLHMEILRFDNASSGEHRRKFSIGWVVTGLVAATLGLGTAFASSTIAINGGTPITLGQGVSAVTACDTDITLVPAASLDAAQSVASGATPVFNVASLAVTDLNIYSNDPATPTPGPGCGGDTLKFDFYKRNSDSSITHASCNDLLGSESTSAITTGGARAGDASCSGGTLSVPIATASSTAANFTITGLKLDPSKLDYITVVSTS